LKALSVQHAPVEFAEAQRVLRLLPLLPAELVVDRMRRRLARLVPSVRALVLVAVVLMTVTLAAAASVVSVGPGARIAIEPEPVVAWIAVAGVVVIFAAMLVGAVLYRRRSRGGRR
jgi:hypothetical protein